MKIDCPAIHLCWRYAYSRYYLEMGYAEPPTREVLFFAGYATPEMMPRGGIFAESIPLPGKPDGRCEVMRGARKEECKEYQKYARQYLRRKQAQEQKEVRQNIPQDIRRLVAARDRYTCVYCSRNINSLYRGQKIGGAIDHHIPLHLGGSNGIENLVLACRKCNSDKGIQIWSRGSRQGFYL